uniref:ZAD domain-containing protein n=1 Tax=Stomoxys calcitrans TaxID=35570 RepID=A0A1I8NWD5_STOCA
MAGMCRLCASLKSSLININAQSEDDTQKLLLCCRIRWENESPLPKSICQICQDELNASYKFLKKVQEAQENLRAFFGIIETTKPADKRDHGNPPFTITEDNQGAVSDFILPENANVKQEQYPYYEELIEGDFQSITAAENDQNTMDTLEEENLSDNGNISEGNIRKSTTKRTLKGHEICKCSELSFKMDEIKAQIDILIDASNEHKTFFRSHLKQNAVEIGQHFPVVSEENLLELNETINPNNKADYVKAMQLLLHPAGVGKNLKYILSSKVTMEYNIDGVHGKNSLKRLKNFYNALLEAIPYPPKHTAPAEDQLRKAIQLQKKREFKALCTARSKKKDASSNKVRRYNFQTKKVISNPIGVEVIAPSMEP